MNTTVRDGLIRASVLAALLSACEPAELSLSDTAEPERDEVTAELGFAGDPANGALYAVDVSKWEGPIGQFEMDCLWDSNVRHVVVGTQVEEITRQQLAMSQARGMSVDAYVYLTWDESMDVQVARAFGRVTGSPIGRLWLDVEEDEGAPGPGALADLVGQAVDSCRARAPAGVGCGIYTGPGYWRGALANTTRFADVPLWYAQYNDVTSLSAWRTERFGGWTAPEAKQWAERALCGVGLDRDTMRVIATPAVVVDRATPPRPTATPGAPTGLYPANGAKSELEYLRLLSATVPWATGYTFSLEHWTGTAWKPYATWSGRTPARKVWPQWLNRLYRHRVRAQNALGVGAWSEWAVFELGTWTEARPSTAPVQPPPVQPPPTQPPPTQPPTQPPPQPPTGGPTGLTPDGATLSTSSVALACAPVANATSYEFVVEFLNGATWAPYYTYSPTRAAQTFYPSLHQTTYRFRVRARVGGAFGPWSTAAQFQFL